MNLNGAWGDAEHSPRHLIRGSVDDLVQHLEFAMRQCIGPWKATVSHSPSAPLARRFMITHCHSNPFDDLWSVNRFLNEVLRTGLDGGHRCRDITPTRD